VRKVTREEEAAVAAVASLLLRVSSRGTSRDAIISWRVHSLVSASENELLSTHMRLLYIRYARLGWELKINSSP
jgi:hypothetical protein